ncbi:Ankyrin repeat domain-containing protein 50 [Colletotrichum aenigma]|uniref:Ankyrin repeat domain-containing protein 50 n=1 Tax=Colletotrichum aenigma TaxID=1215731 RepID=UPI0018722CC7|nr:Ankyrin repeat domain-containing protein 50 [Colletotrichum aenigma]KAF5527604.1 Ankyrin repeat domain-containing protein 50 [Colletotrichum aenigma]
MEIPSSQSDSGVQTDLQLGVASKDVEIVKDLLSQGADPIIDPQEGQHPLIMASGNGSLAIVQELIQAGAPVNVHGKKRRSYMYFQAADASPMHAAIANGSLDVVKVLLENGADIELSVHESGTPLTIAAAKGRVSIMRHLLLAGANDSSSSAVRKAIENNHLDIVRVLLGEGAQAINMLSVACERGRTKMIELLIESIPDKGSLETALDGAFAVAGLAKSVIRVLLCFAAPTAQRFLKVSAVGSAFSVKLMLEQGDIDVNLPTEDDGNLPLQVAALNLNFEAVQVLLEIGAHTECTSAEHGTPLITALEVCAVSTLRTAKDEGLRKIVNSLTLPNARKPSPTWALGRGDHYTSQYKSMQQLSKCSAIVQFLIDHGANVADVGRPLGSPLHLTCLLGSSAMVEKLIQRGADLDATAGYFEKPVFAAIHGKNADIVSLLLKHTPTPSHVHTEYSTPLHYACAVDDAASVRKLLECGADAAIANRLGETPLTIALRNFCSEYWPGRDRKETFVDVIISMAESLRVSDHDIVAASQLGTLDSEKTIRQLLDLDKSAASHEDTMCHILTSRSYAVADTIKLLMPRMGGIGVTDRMLKCGPSEQALKALLDCTPMSKVPKDVLLAQENVACMELLLKFDSAAPATQEILLRALELKDYGGETKKGVLAELFKRNPALCVTQDMLQAVDSAAILEIFLSHFRPVTGISEDTLGKIFTSVQWQVQETLRILHQHNPSIQFSDKIVLQSLEQSSRRLTPLNSFWTISHQWL